MKERGKIMANSEYYTANEFKETREFKEIKAEIYLKPKEIKDTVKEIKDGAPETTFGNSAPNKPKKKVSLRKKVTNLFDKVKESATRLAGSVTGAIAVGAAAVVVTAGIISSPVPEPSPEPDNPPVYTEYGAFLNEISLNEAIVIKEEDKHIVVLPDIFEMGENENFIYSVSIFDESNQNIGSYTGIDKDVFFVLDAAPSYIEYKEIFNEGNEEIVFTTTKRNEEYTPLALIDSFNLEKSRVEFLEGENQIFVPLNYKGINASLFYKMIFKDESGNEIAYYEGDDKEFTISLPSEKNITSIIQYYYGNGQKSVKLYERELFGKLILKSPTVEFVSRNVVDGEYRVDFKISTENPNESYNLKISEENYYFEEYFENIKANKDYNFLLHMDKEISQMVLKSELTVSSYGGQRVVKSEKSYENQNELYASAVCDLYENRLKLDFYYCADEGSYILLTNKETEEALKIEDGYYYADIENSEYRFTYQLFSALDEPLSEEREIFYSIPSEIPEYMFNYKNPSDYIITYNSDKTVNLYAESGFECSDENVFYRLELRGRSQHVLESRDSVMSFEGILYDEYGIYYSIIYVKDGVEYLLQSTVPSGTIYDYGYGMVYFDEESLSLKISEDASVEGSIEIIIDGEAKTVLISDFVKEEYYLNYYFEEKPSTLKVKLKMASAVERLEELKDKYGEDAIVGDPYQIYEIELI